MAKTLSSMLPLGTLAPSFQLMDTRTGKMTSLEESRGKLATVVLFICNHCPYVKYIQKKLVEVIKEYQQKNISFIAINSNDILQYPDDNPEKMREEAKAHGYTFPYLFDETQEVAKAYHAACTPDFFVFDKDMACVYRGRFDDATPGNVHPVTGKDLTNALDAIIAQKSIDSNQYPSMGCNIKWKQ